jgi:hypothetical protein
MAPSNSATEPAFRPMLTVSVQQLDDMNMVLYQVDSAALCDVPIHEK